MLPETDGARKLRVPSRCATRWPPWPFLSIMAVPAFLSPSALAWRRCTRARGSVLYDLVNRADKALYRVKESGRNAVYCADLPQGACAAGQMHRSDPQDCAGGSLLS